MESDQEKWKLSEVIICSEFYSPIVDNTKVMKQMTYGCRRHLIDYCNLFHSLHCRKFNDTNGTLSVSAM